MMNFANHPPLQLLACQRRDDLAVMENSNIQVVVMARTQLNFKLPGLNLELSSCFLQYFSPPIRAVIHKCRILIFKVFIKVQSS